MRATAQDVVEPPFRFLRWSATPAPRASAAITMARLPARSLTGVVCPLPVFGNVRGATALGVAVAVVAEPTTGVIAAGVTTGVRSSVGVLVCDACGAVAIRVGVDVSISPTMAVPVAVAI